MPRFKYILLFISISNLSKNYLYPLVEYWVDVSNLELCMDQQTSSLKPTDKTHVHKISLYDRNRKKTELYNKLSPFEESHFLKQT